MKKRVFSVLTCAALTLLVLTACSSNKAETSAQDQSSDAKGSEAVESSSQEEENVTKAVVVEAVDKTKVYVTPQWVDSLINGLQEESKDYVILECSWGEQADAEMYKKGHLPGAVHMNTDSVEENPMK